ncbi:hypothetical protein TVAG_307840 [Trichomonas vaginalis G3]|uniref:Uncharacterized protein n=1 Tax=Trichomonas vaginalis (strain ATCC PRA-98 / G3) TaxID=412133 RepID=A2F437_TRIV3|nr:glycoprotein 38 family [Trichomonas vaginalis G3]EAY00338.1 hypothetical protein TVAG_307840 [Trichomonas vaginalis G3]KAI5508368.1 glycoprotein 38 family [Trichomonas vaginalis G3]|eukprot:XP_001313267.1 hypothetical protein [Trichomonas vaginalis G3]
MLALFLIRSYSEIQAIEGCTDVNTFDAAILAKISYHSVQAGEVICYKGSIVMQANKEIIVTYKFVDEEKSIDGTLNTFKNPFYICSHDKKPYTKIAAKDQTKGFDISVVSVHGSKNESNKNIWEVFSTARTFNKSVTISPLQSVRLIAENSNSLRLTINNTNIQKHITYDEREDIESGSSLYLELSSINDGEEMVEIYYKPNLDAFSVGFRSLFEENIFYILPGEGVFNVVDIKLFTRDHRSIFREIQDESNDDENGDESGEIEWDPDAVLYCQYIIGSKFERVSKFLTIQPGGVECSQGSFVYASKDKFDVTVYKRKDKQGNLYHNPFSTCGIHLNVIKCANSSEECRVHIISVEQPIFSDAETKNSIFTTKNELNFTHIINVTDTKSESFSLISHSAQIKEVKVTFDKPDVYFSLYNADDENAGQRSQGKTIFGDFRLAPPPGETTAYVSIKELRTILDDDDESLFENDLVYEIPDGVKTEEEVKNYSRTSNVTVVRDNNKITSNKQDPTPERTPEQISAIPTNRKLSSGEIAGIVIAVLVAIAIICILVWLFVCKKKTEKNDSGSGENV